jgi:chain length determinant protein tyrosine kinase EpsG
MNAPLSATNTASRAELTIGRILLDQGKISAQDAERVLHLQKEKNLLFGAAALQLGLINAGDIEQVLARQFEYPYLNAGEGGFSQELVAAYNPFSPQVESLRGLRSQLMLRWFALGNKTLTLVGVNPGDGSSFLAANLAVVFSQLGERTLLIDANLRSPGISSLFNLGSGMGLSDLLADRVGLDVVVRIPDFVDLSVLPAGTLPPNPAELLSRSHLTELLETLAFNYDIILLDTPAASVAADFQIAAARTRGAVVAVRKNRSRVNDIAAMRAMITATGAEVVGAVVNDY